jgi:hypothetical protein
VIRALGISSKDVEILAAQAMQALPRHNVS